MKEISVLMSVYNQERYLDISIQSILSQTYSEFEFIIINDGSTDKSLEIIKEYSYRDKRIKIMNQNNIGLTKSLNNSLLNLNTTYIARMDADDASHPDRLKKQINEFKKNKNLSLLGTAAKYIDLNGKKIFFSKQLKSFSDIKKYQYYTSPFIAPSVMFKHKDFKDLGLFDETFKYSQDYDAWLRFIFNNKQCANLNEPLIDVRVHDNNISSIHKVDQGRFSLFAKQLSKSKYILNTQNFNQKNLEINKIFGLLPHKHQPQALEILECEEIDPIFDYSSDNLKNLFYKIKKTSSEKSLKSVKARIYIKLAKRFYDKKKLFFSIRVFLLALHTDFFEIVNFIVFKFLTKKYT